MAGLKDIFKGKQAAEPETANDRHLSWKQLEALQETGGEVWFRYADESKPQVNSGYVNFVGSTGRTDLYVTRWDDEPERRHKSHEFLAKHVEQADIFASREDLVAANEEREQMRAADFAKAVEGIHMDSPGQER